MTSIFRGLLVIFLTSAFSLAGCTVNRNINKNTFFVTPSRLEGSFTEGPKCTETAPYYEYLFRYKSRIIPENFDKFTVLVDSQVDPHKSITVKGLRKKLLSPFEIGHAAWFVSQAVREVFGEKEYRQVLKGLSSYHLIIPSNKEKFDEVWNGQTTNRNLRGRMAVDHVICFITPKNSSFTAVILPEFITREHTTTLVHELIHMAYWAIAQDTDGATHGNPRLWLKLDNKNSVQAIAVRKFNAWLASKK